MSNILGFRKNGKEGRDTTGLNKQIFKDNKASLFTSNSKKAKFIYNEIIKELKNTENIINNKIVKMLFGKNGLGYLCANSFFTKSKSFFNYIYKKIELKYKKFKIDAITQAAQNSGDSSIREISENTKKLKNEIDEKIKEYEWFYKEYNSFKDSKNFFIKFGIGSSALYTVILGIASIAFPAFSTLFVAYNGIIIIASMLYKFYFFIKNKKKFKNKMINELKNNNDKSIKEAEIEFNDLKKFFETKKNELDSMYKKLNKSNINFQIEQYKNYFFDFLDEIYTDSKLYIENKNKEKKFFKYDIDQYKIKFFEIIQDIYEKNDRLDVPLDLIDENIEKCKDAFDEFDEDSDDYKKEITDDNKETSVFVF